jgi:molybdopterin-guanine dinucleotide biosynthesis protein A
VDRRDASALILCGGQSSRFGSDKALALFEGQALIARAAQAARSRFAHVALVAKDAAVYAAHASGAALVNDGAAASTPLAGLAAGLAWAPTELVFATAVDMPFAFDDRLVAALFEQIAHRAAAVPQQGGALQPLCSLWRRSSALGAARTLLEQNAGPRALARAVDAVVVPWADPRPFLDADTPALLDALQRRE